MTHMQRLTARPSSEMENSHLQLPFSVNPPWPWVNLAFLRSIFKYSSHSAWKCVFFSPQLHCWRTVCSEMKNRLKKKINIQLLRLGLLQRPKTGINPLAYSMLDSKLIYLCMHFIFAFSKRTKRLNSAVIVSLFSAYYSGVLAHIVKDHPSNQRIPVLEDLWLLTF